MQVQWLTKAKKNLEAVLEHLHDENPAAARQLAIIVRAATLSLAEFPARGRPGRIAGTRELVIEGYPFIIPYRVRGDSIQIIRIFHTRKDLPKRG
jgi:toxin ParE1/3/4